MTIFINQNDVDAQARQVFSSENVQVENQACDIDWLDFFSGDWGDNASSTTSSNWVSLIPSRPEPEPFIIEEGEAELFQAESRGVCGRSQELSVVATNDEVAKEFENLNESARAKLIKFFVCKSRDSTSGTRNGFIDLTGDDEDAPGTAVGISYSVQIRWSSNKNLFQYKISELEIL